MTLFMGMGLGLKITLPQHETNRKLEFSIGLGHKNDIIHGYGVRVENNPPPPNMKQIQNWDSR